MQNVIESDLPSLEYYKECIERDGCFVLPSVLKPDAIAHLKERLQAAIDAEAAVHGGTQYQDYGMVLMCALYDRCFIDLFDTEALIAPFSAILGEGCIVYGYTSSSMPPHATNYSRRIHVDSPRLIPGYITNMGATIALSDFTEENGATWYLPNSQTRLEPPTPEYFFKHAKRFIAPAGSIFFFNARIWHAGGENITDQWRHALTINMCRPYMKQRLDIPRMLEGKDLSYASSRALQKLGFYAQVPASYEEFYAPKEQRKFRQDPE